MRHKIIYSIFILIAAVLSPHIATSQEKLRIGIDGTNPPFSHRDIDGKYSGLEIDLIGALCAKMKAGCTFVQFPWDNIIPALRGGKIDIVVATQTLPSDNNAQVLYSKPYMKMPSMVVVRKDSLLSGISGEDLQNTLVGALNSSPHSEYLHVHFSGLKIKAYERTGEYFTDLINRQLDAIVGNPIILHQWLNSKEGSACCRKLGNLKHDVKINGAGYSVVVGQNAVKLLEKLNKALDSISQSGKLAKIMQLHFPSLR